jgi:UDP-N-acetylmuramyl pentapeptide synthase
MRLMYHRAARHRRRLSGVTFVGITGSCGKTTTKELVAAVLARHGRVMRTPGNHNAGQWVARTVLGARPHHDYCVQEIGAGGPGSLDAPIAVVRPRVAVVTNIGDDHRSAFRNLETTAAEKRKLVAAVPGDGIAVLNADDPRVLAMAGACRGRVVTYGLGEGAAVRGERVVSEWPGRLSFVVRHGSASAMVATRFNGAHWVHACLAAIAVGLALGVSLADAVAAVATVEPWVGRLSEVEVDGVVFVRDECKAPLWTVTAALEFLRTAHAPRRIAVFGTLSDYRGRASAVYAGVARQALDVADEVIFVGAQAARCEGARAHPRGSALRVFATAREASEHLARSLRPGDLVLLKGSNRADHLVRLVLARGTGVSCWRTGCRRLKFCDECLLRRVPELPLDA